MSKELLAERHSSAEVNLQPREPDWGAWKKAYEETRFIDDRIQALYGWPLNKYGDIPFFLKEAEGFRSSGHFVAEGEKYWGDAKLHTLFGTFQSVFEARQEIAKTAFSRLVTQLFKDSKESVDRLPSWVERVANVVVIEALIHFFRLGENQRFVNWPDTYSPQGEFQAKITIEFLTTLCEYGWKQPYQLREPYRELFQQYRLQFIPILWGLRKLDNLLRYKIGAEESEVVTKLALEGELNLPKYDDPFNEDKRKPVSLEEAAFGGSQAGEVALILRERQRMEKRWEELKRAHRDKIEAEKEVQRKIESLNLNTR